MARYCIVCKKLYVSGDSTSFHCFPRNSELRAKWMSEIGISSVHRNARVCQDHFDISCYHPYENYISNHKLLRSEAVPNVRRKPPSDISNIQGCSSENNASGHVEKTVDVDPLMSHSNENVPRIKEEFPAQFLHLEENLNFGIECNRENNVPQSVFALSVNDNNIQPQISIDYSKTSTLKSINIYYDPGHSPNKIISSSDTNKQDVHTGNTNFQKTDALENSQLKHIINPTDNILKRKSTVNNVYLQPTIKMCISIDENKSTVNPNITAESSKKSCLDMIDKNESLTRKSTDTYEHIQPTTAVCHPNININSESIKEENDIVDSNKFSCSNATEKNGNLKRKSTDSHEHIQPTTTVCHPNININSESIKEENDIVDGINGSCSNATEKKGNLKRKHSSQAYEDFLKTSKKYKCKNGTVYKVITSEDFKSDETWNHFVKIIIQNKNKNEALRRKFKRRENKINSLKDMIKASEKKAEQDAAEYLKSLPLVLQQIIARMKNNKPTSPFPEEMKSFARSLRSHSAAAYEMVRTTFLKCLPAAESLNRWENAKNNPGINQDISDNVSAFVVEEKREGKHLRFNLTFDDMGIIKQWAYYCKMSKQWKGLVDQGGQLDNKKLTDDSGNAIKAIKA